MFYARWPMTALSILGKKAFPPLLIKKSYRNYAQAVQTINHYHYNNDNDMVETQCSSCTICEYCKGSRFVKCNLCRNGCINCNFTEIIPCPFCNSSGGVYTTDKGPSPYPS